MKLKYEHAPDPTLTVQDVMDFVGEGIEMYAMKRKENELNQIEETECYVIRRDAAVKSLMAVFAFCKGEDPESFIQKFLIKNN